jgi:hypothetical protein
LDHAAAAAVAPIATWIGWPVSSVFRCRVEGLERESCRRNLVADVITLAALVIVALSPLLRRFYIERF